MEALGRRRVQIAKSATLVGALVLLTMSACVPENNQIGVLLGKGGDVDVIYVRCVERPEAVRTVRLTEAASKRVLWEVTDRRANSESMAEPEVQRFTIGDIPQGFDEEVPLSGPLTEDGDYYLEVRGLNLEGFPFVPFRLDDLDEGYVHGPIEGPTDEFIDRASKECDPPVPPSGLVIVARLLGAALVILVCVAAVRWNGRRF
jgi:hypothetical protein